MRIFSKGVCILLTIVLFMCLFTYKTAAQDIHFSQYYNSPLNVNPAQTGFMESRYRFGLNHRNQWSSVTVPFVTYSAFGDVQVFKRKYQADILAIGFVANKDEAGDSEFGTSQVNMTLSYIKALGNQNKNIISFGVMAGWVQRSINYSKLTFDEQYSGGVFNPGIGVTESFAIDNFSYTDFAAGFHWSNIASYDFNIQTGVALWHLSQPNQSFMKSKDAQLPMKALLYSEAEIRSGIKYKLYPGIFISNQDAYWEVIPSFKVKYELNASPYQYTALTFGAMYRVNDAFVVLAGIDYKKVIFQLSYDVNVSKLRVASAYQGGFELTTIFKFSKQKQKRIKRMECPIF